MLAKLTPSLLGLAAAAAPIVAPLVQTWIAAHPNAAALIGGLAVIAANFAPQPHK